MAEHIGIVVLFFSATYACYIGGYRRGRADTFRQVKELIRRPKGT